LDAPWEAVEDLFLRRRVDGKFLAAGTIEHYAKAISWQ
jgi:hypothetical protein